jgi:hypothetical protein
MICGHVHGKWKTKWHGNVLCVNVGVDVWDYNLVTKNDILSIYAKEKKKRHDRLKQKRESCKHTLTSPVRISAGEYICPECHDDISKEVMLHQFTKMFPIFPKPHTADDICAVRCKLCNGLVISEADGDVQECWCGAITIAKSPGGTLTLLPFSWNIYDFDCQEDAKVELKRRIE